MSDTAGPTQPVSVHILDREYTVGVQPSEREGLLAAARLVEARMREIRGNNRMVALERVAVLAALNLAHEMEMLKQDGARREDALARVVEVLERHFDIRPGTPSSG